MTPDVFSPARLGPLTLRNRTIKAATFEARSPGGLVSQDLVDYHVAVAEGGVGMTTVAYLAVSPEGRTDAAAIHLRAEVLPGLQRLTDAVHERGALVAGQLGHSGPVGNGRSNGKHALAASAMPSPLSMQMVRKASERDLTRVTDDFVAAARLGVRGGLDCLELHFGHNYLVSSFLSPNLNRRKDRWGGSLENRARLARQVARAVRDEVGQEVAVIAKMSMKDGAPGGFNLPESVELAQMLEADGTLDAIELSAGSSLMNPMYLFRGDAPREEFRQVMPPLVSFGMKYVGERFLRSYPYEEAYLLPLAREFRAAVSMPLILLGGISTKATMDLAMAEGFEYVAMARALLREPDLLRRMQEGTATEGACIHCNKCMPTVYSRTHCWLSEHPVTGPAASPVGQN
ncbi:MAG: NADH:flavin oxidoreductase [Nocardioides sp.]|nr:NADH:flavin oxidoreductase [Nocardioides sp.]